MAAVPLQKTVEQWLNQRLEEPWSANRLASLLTPTIVASVRERMATLDASTKTRVVLATLCLRYNGAEGPQLRQEVEALLDEAEHDEDGWVCMLAKSARTVPTHGSLTLPLHHETFQKTVEDLSALSDRTRGPPPFHPLEDVFLSPHLLPLGDSTPIQHFRIRREAADLGSVLRRTTSEEVSRRREELEVVSGLRAVADGTPPPLPPLRSSMPMNHPPTRHMGLGERRGYQKRARINVIDVDEAINLTKAMEAMKRQQEDDARLEMDRRRKAAEEHAAIQVEVREAEKERRKKEKEEMKERKQHERLEKRRKKEELQKHLEEGSAIRPKYAPSLGQAAFGPSDIPGLSPTTLPVPLATAAAAKKKAISFAKRHAHDISGISSNLSQEMQGQPAPLAPLPGLQSMRPLQMQATQPPHPPFILPSTTAATATAPPQVPSPQPMDPRLFSAIFESSNRLEAHDRQAIERFLVGERVNPTPDQGNIRQIILNEERKEDGTSTFLEQIIFEINYEKGTWRKLRRKRIFK